MRNKRGSSGKKTGDPDVTEKIFLRQHAEELAISENPFADEQGPVKPATDALPMPPEESTEIENLEDIVRYAGSDDSTVTAFHLKSLPVDDNEISQTISYKKFLNHPSQNHERELSNSKVTGHVIYPKNKSQAKRWGLLGFFIFLLIVVFFLALDMGLL